MSNRLNILAVTAIAPITWGTTYAVTTEFLPPDAPMFTSLMRALPAGLLLLALTRTLPRGDWWWRASVLGVLNVGAFFPLLFLGAYRLPGGVAATIGAVQPLIVVALAGLLLTERLTALKIGAGLAGLAGVGMLVLTPNATLDTWGVVGALGGAVVMGFGVVLTKKWSPPVRPLTLTAWQLTAGGLFLLPLAAIEGVPAAPFEGDSLLGYLWIGLFCTALAYVLWFRGISKVPASVVTFLSLLIALTATVIGWVWLDQSLGLIQLGGAVLVVGAVALAALDPTGKGAPSAAPAPVRQ